MAENVNDRILKKIQVSHFDENVKEFLTSMLIVELKNFEIGRLRYSDEYERNIRKHIQNKTEAVKTNVD